MFAKKASLIAGLLLAMTFSGSVFADPAKAAPPATQPAASTTQPAPKAETTAKAPATQPAARPEPIAQEIPLASVSAVRMPGTLPLDISTAPDGQSFTNVESVLLSEILGSLKKFGTDTRGGFAVNGWDYEALDAAHRILVKDEEPAKLSRDRRIALVFFSYQQGMDVQIRRIIQKGNQVEITFFKVPRNDREFGAQLAIIPLPQVPVGGLKVVLIGQIDPAYSGAATVHGVNDTVFAVVMK